MKVDLFPDEVFVFTPKGDVINLPAGRDADRLRLRDPQRGRRALRGREGERPDGAAAAPARRTATRSRSSPANPSCRARTGSTSWRRPRAQQDPPRDAGARERAQPRARPRPPRPRAAQGGLVARRACSRAAASTSSRSAEAMGQIDELFALVGYGKLAASDVVREAAREPAPEPVPRRRGAAACSGASRGAARRASA